MNLFIFFLNFLVLSGGARGGLLDINPGLIFWLFITFIILLLLLKKVAWKPIIKSLELRENGIKDAIEKAELSKLEAEKILEENRKNLAEAEKQSQKIILEGREFANKLRQEIIDKSNEEAKKLIEQAKQEIDRKKSEALNELRGTIADLAIKATEKIISVNLDENKQKELLNKYIENLPKN